MTTAIIPSINRPTLQRAISSALEAGMQVLVGLDDDREGAGPVRNMLIREADTEWVSMLDDDDTMTPDYLKRLKEEIENNPDADVVIFREYFTCNEWDRDVCPKHERGHILPRGPVFRRGNIPISYSVKRKVALEHPFNAEEAEDYFFIERLQKAGYKIVFSKYITYKVRH